MPLPDPREQPAVMGGPGRLTPEECKHRTIDRSRTLMSPPRIISDWCRDCHMHWPGGRHRHGVQPPLNESVMTYESTAYVSPEEDDHPDDEDPHEPEHDEGDEGDAERIVVRDQANTISISFPAYSPVIDVHSHPEHLRWAGPWPWSRRCRARREPGHPDGFWGRCELAPHSPDVDHALERAMDYPRWSTRPSAWSGPWYGGDGPENALTTAIAP